MSKEVIIEPQELWRYYNEKKHTLSNIMYEIASNREFGIAIYLTGDKDGASIVVEADNVEVYSEIIIDEKDAARSCEKIYNKYLSESVVDTLSKFFGDNTELEQEECIEEREMELDEAVSLFLDAALGYGSDFITDEDMVEDIKDHFLEYLARKWKLHVRRPMFLEDDSGEFYSEYPYECMVFDDDDNPIYK